MFSREYVGLLPFGSYVQKDLEKPKNDAKERLINHQKLVFLTSMLCFYLCSMSKDVTKHGLDDNKTVKSDEIKEDTSRVLGSFSTA